MVLMSIAIALFTTPIILMYGSDLQGSDDAAMQMIQEIAPSYQPWTSSFWNPSENWQTIFFLVQAVLGAGYIGYYFGKKRRRVKKEANKTSK